jgi:predicted pyridoxine 5'-phosphate oxidase superfamily flavin-nucleotide-binding protein
MSDFYTPSQRELQEAFATRDLAQRLEDAIVTATLSDEQATFIHGRNLFFLSTVDEQGFPSCSYKGGNVGFVRALNPSTLVFPSYDGNGMFMSLGNISASARVGLLFIDFETPQRLRLRGEARLLKEGPVVDSYPGAELAVEIAIDRVWVNCPRYVHPMQPLDPSPYVPAADGTAPFAPWKRIDVMQDVLPATDRARAEALGLLTVEDYEALVAAGRLE